MENIEARPQSSQIDPQTRESLSSNDGSGLESQRPVTLHQEAHDEGGDSQATQPAGQPAAPEARPAVQVPPADQQEGDRQQEEEAVGEEEAQVGIRPISVADVANRRINPVVRRVIDGFTAVSSSRSNPDKSGPIAALWGGLSGMGGSIGGGAVFAGAVKSLTDVFNWAAGRTKNTGEHLAGIHQRKEKQNIFGRIADLLKAPGRFLTRKSLKPDGDFEEAAEVVLSPDTMEGRSSRRLERLMAKAAHKAVVAESMVSATLASRRYWGEKVNAGITHLSSGAQIASEIWNHLTERIAEKTRREGRPQYEAGLKIAQMREDLENRIKWLDRKEHALNIIRNSTAVALVAGSISVFPKVWSWTKKTITDVSAGINSWWSDPKTTQSVWARKVWWDNFTSSDNTFWKPLKIVGEKAKDLLLWGRGILNV